MAAKLPRLHQHLQSIGCDMTIIGATDWILCLYTTSLPAEVLLKQPSILLCNSWACAPFRHCVPTRSQLCVEKCC